ncbi:hypothetical protein EON67_06815, partial [archaeon]
EHQIDYIVHGDDPCITADGKDAYAYAKSIGKYRQIKRTEGVSTTDIVGRMLLMTREHHLPAAPTPLSLPASDAVLSPADSVGSRSVRSSSLSAARAEEADSSDAEEAAGAGGAAASASALPAMSSKFLPTARRIMQFADGRVPKPDDKVVYIAGSWDMFNSGHIAALREARKLGDFLLVGIHDDATVHALRGHNLPILNLYERTLSLLSCKYVDEVIIGAPWVISEEMIKTMNISVVARGSNSDFKNAAAQERLGWKYADKPVLQALEEAYTVPLSMGIVRSFTSPSTLTALDVVHRILAARATFESRYERKSKMEAEYVANKGYVEEH